MSVGAFLSTKSEIQNYEKHKKIEYWEVDHLPEKERAEIREIYEGKGFQGELLDQVVNVICADRDRWVDVMMKEELEMQEETKSPFAMGAVTFISFVFVGLIPLLVYVNDYLMGGWNVDLFFWSCVFTGLAFIMIGYLKARVTQNNVIRSIIETLFLGTAAAVLSYVVGNFLERLF